MKISQVKIAGALCFFLWGQTLIAQRVTSASLILNFDPPAATYTVAMNVFEVDADAVPVTILLPSSQISIVTPTHVQDSNVNMSSLNGDWALTTAVMSADGASNVIAISSTGANPNLGAISVGVTDLFSFSIPGGCDEGVTLYVNGTPLGGIGLSLDNAVVIAFSGEVYNGINSNNVSCPSLPVELTQFAAVARPDHKVWLSWETASEINNDFFIVKHSIDGLNFDEIGRVAGNGTTAISQFYDFEHQLPVVGTNYYQLRQVDFDGEFKDSPIRSVEFTGLSRLEFRVFPNPSGRYLMILPPDEAEAGSGSSDSWNMEVYDMQGKLVEQFLMRDASYRLDVDEWPAAVYQIIARNGRTIKQMRFVKD